MKVPVKGKHLGLLIQHNHPQLIWFYTSILLIHTNRSRALFCSNQAKSLNEADILGSPFVITTMEKKQGQIHDFTGGGKGLKGCTDAWKSTYIYVSKISKKLSELNPIENLSYM